MSIDPDRLMTTAEVAEYLGAHRKTVEGLFKSRQISFVRINGGHYRTRRRWIDEFLDRHTVPAEATSRHRHQLFAS